MKATEVYLSLGSNLQGPITQVMQGIKRLNQLPDTTLINASSLYRTKPWGMVEQADFINAVVKLHTTLPARTLLAHLLALEVAQGRVRKLKWGPRIIDYDILLYGQKTFNEAQLTIPHPQMHCRDFVLIPLAEIAPGLILSQGPIQSLISKDQQVEKLISETI